MKFSCDSCSAQYMIADEKVGPRGVKVRCKKCGHIILVKRAPTEEAASAPVPAPPPAPTGDLGLDVELGQAFDAMLSEKKAETDQLSVDLAASPREEEDFPIESSRKPEPQPQPQGQATAVSNEWYVAVHDQQVGPLTLAGVRSRWDAGEIGPDSLVWCSGMSDWKPLSTVPALADVLSPGPTLGARPKKEPAAAPAPAAPEPAPAPQTSESSWQPNAAGALAALANQEMATMAQPEVKNGATAGAKPVGGGSLIDSMNLPDSGGVDPTGAIPLNIKGLDVTEEAELKRTSSVARSAAEVRERRSTTRTIVIAVAAFAIITLAGVGGVFFYFEQKLAPSRPGETVAVAPPPVPAAAPPAAVPPPPPPPPAPPVAAAPPPATPPAGSPAAASAPTTPTPAPTPAAAPSAPSLQNPPLVAAAPMPNGGKPAEEPPARTKRSRVEPPPKLPAKRPSRVAAAAEPAPEPEKPKRGGGGDPLLDFPGGSDSDFEKDLGGGKKRNVYVPPAPGGDLPSEVSQGQIQEGVASRMSGLRDCLAKQEAADPNAHGVLKLRWVIGPDGSVSGVRSMTPELANAPITKCMSGVVKTIRFPRSKTTGQEVTFPIKF